MKVEQRIENDRIFYDEKGVTQVKEIKRDMGIGSNLFTSMMMHCLAKKEDKPLREISVRYKITLFLCVVRLQIS